MSLSQKSATFAGHAQSGASPCRKSLQLLRDMHRAAQVPVAKVCSFCGTCGEPKRQPACKPGSVPATNCGRWPFLWDDRCRPPRATNPGDGSGADLDASPRPYRPYSVLLPVGLAMPPTLPPARCALTAPFHPYRPDVAARRRSALCGAFPGVAPAGRYPAPFLRGARTFLRPARGQRPSGRLALAG